MEACLERGYVRVLDPQRNPCVRLSLASLLAGVFGAVVLVAATSVLLPEWLIARRVTFELLNERAIGGISALEAGVRARLEPARATVDELAALIERGGVALEDMAGLRLLLEGALAGNPEIAAVVVVRADRTEIVAERKVAGTISSKTEPAGRDVSGLIVAADGQAGTFWGDVLFVPEIGQPVINVRRALRRDGEVVGVIGAGVTIRDLSALVTGLGGVFGGTPFILYGADRVLAHPRLVGDRWADPAGPLLASRAELGDPVLAATSDRFQLDSFARAREAGITVEGVRDALGDEDAILVTKTLGSFGGTLSTIGFWLPEKVAEQALVPLRVGLVIGLGLLALALATAIVVGRLVARPILRATAGATRIAQLDIADVEPLPPSRLRELDEQADAFNAMLATIRAFATYVPRSLVQRLVRNGGQDAIRSRERDLTVMFTDIAGFTRAAERLPATRIAELLNQHFGLLAACIEAEGGTVDKFLGDGLMAFWGAPERLKERALRGCRAALAIRDAVTADNDERAAHGQPQLKLRIGIHKGPLVVGNIGAPDRLNYTVVGDAANVAQRLEQLGKEVGKEVGIDDAVVIIVSDAVVNDAGPGLAFEPLGDFAIRGRGEPIAAYRLLGSRPL